MLEVNRVYCRLYFKSSVIFHITTAGMIMTIVQINIIVSSMRLEMWPQWGGVIGDKVTLMFRLFNTHLFTHTLLCPPFKSRVFSWEKVMSPEKGHNGPVWAFQMCCRGCSCQRHAVSQLSSLFMRSSTFSSGFASDDASPLFPGHCKANPEQLFLWKNMGFQMS